GEFLAKQGDVMVLASQRRFGEPCEPPDEIKDQVREWRMQIIWRMLLLGKFGLGSWSLHVDADEFVVLPPGVSLDDFCRELDKRGDEAVWGAMLDMYPECIGVLREQQKDLAFDPGQGWHFDGQPHLRLRTGTMPRTVYGGSRARLMARYGLNHKVSRRKSVASRFIPWYVPAYNLVRKPVLFKWREGRFLLNNHNISFEGSTNFLLPIKHYKFTGDLYRRVIQAIQLGSHYDGSSEYRNMRRLLEKMEQEDADFRYPKSMPADNFDNFRRSGNIVGF
ncbi:MAG: glycosyltransferase family 2 protein, partial [Pseudomonadota bacterium]